MQQYNFNHSRRKLQNKNKNPKMHLELTIDSSAISEQKFIQALFSFPSFLSSTLLPAPATADRTPAKGVGAEPKRHLAGGCGGEGALERGRGGRGAGAPAAAYEEVRGLPLVVREAASRTGTSKVKAETGIQTPRSRMVSGARRRRGWMPRRPPAVQPRDDHAC